MFPINLTGGVAEAVCALVSLVILWTLLNEKHDEGEIDGFLIVTTECTFAMLISDCVTNFLSFYGAAVVLLTILNFITYLLTCVTLNVFGMYCLSYLKEYVKIKKARSFVININAVLLSFASLWWWVVTFQNENIIFEPNKMIYGGLHWTTQLFLVIAIILLCGYIWSTSKAIGINNCIVLSLSELIPLIILCHDYLIGSAPAYVAFALSLLVIYARIHVEKNVDIAGTKKLLAEKEKELTETNARIMVSQMQPHFMYNVLNSIYYLCEKDSEEAQDAISTFSDYLRINMDSMGKKELVTFNEELRHVRIYLRLEKMRFSERMNVEYDIKADDFSLPCLSLQPMVENAVKHGICKRPEGGTVRISTDENDDEYIIEIKDDGVGYDVTGKSNDNSRSHIGRENVRKRIESMCNGSVVFESTIGVGSTTTIHIPKNV